MALTIDILCSDPDHNSRRGRPGHRDKLGKGDRPVTGMICAACAVDVNAARLAAAGPATVADLEARVADILAEIEQLKG